MKAWRTGGSCALIAALALTIPRSTLADEGGSGGYAIEAEDESPFRHITPKHGAYVRLAPGLLGARLDGRGGIGFMYGASAGFSRMHERKLSLMVGVRATHRFSFIELEDRAESEFESWIHPGLELRLGYRTGRLFVYGLFTPGFALHLVRGSPTLHDFTRLGGSLGGGAGLAGFVTPRLFIGTEVEIALDLFFTHWGLLGGEDGPSQQLQWHVNVGWTF